MSVLQREINQLQERNKELLAEIYTFNSPEGLDYIPNFYLKRTPIMLTGAGLIIRENIRKIQETSIWNTPTKTLVEAYRTRINLREKMKIRSERFYVSPTVWKQVVKTSTGKERVVYRSDTSVNKGQFVVYAGLGKRRFNLETGKYE